MKACPVDTTHRVDNPELRTPARYVKIVSFNLPLTRVLGFEIHGSLDKAYATGLAKKAAMHRIDGYPLKILLQKLIVFTVFVITRLKTFRIGRRVGRYTTTRKTRRRISNGCDRTHS